MILSRKPSKKPVKRGVNHKTISSEAPAGSNRLFKLARIGIVLLLVFIGLQFGRQYGRYLSAAENHQNHSEQLAYAQNYYAELEKKKALINDDAYIERLARKNMGLVKEGETLLRPATETDMPVLDPNLDVENYNH